MVTVHRFQWDKWNNCGNSTQQKKRALLMFDEKSYGIVWKFLTLTICLSLPLGCEGVQNQNSLY